MPKATGEFSSCEREYLELAGEADALFDKFLSATGAASGFHPAMQRIEGQLEAARHLQDAKSDLQLNEAVVIADKLEAELAIVEQSAPGAALFDTEEEWASAFEQVKDSLESMQAHLSKMRSNSKGYEDGAVVEVQSLSSSFRRHAKSCRGNLGRLKLLLSERSHPVYSKVESAKRNIGELRASVGKSFSRITRKKLAGRIEVARSEIVGFMERERQGRIFADHKHLTISGSGRKMRVPLTQALRFALEDLGPIEKTIAKVEKGKAFLLGTYEFREGRMVLRLGERMVAGDVIIYREKCFELAGSQ